MRRTLRTLTLLSSTACLLLGALGACSSSSDSGGGGTPSLTPAERLCKAVKDSVARCGGGACDQALVDDCAKLTAVLSDPFLDAARACIEKGGTASSCLGAGVSALTPTAAQKDFVQKFCSDCPPTPIPGCTDALLGGKNVPDALSAAKQLILPLGDAVLADVEKQCFGNKFTCLADFSSCVEQVLASRAVPTNTIQCLVDSLVNGAGTTTGATCGTDGGVGGNSGSGGSGTGGTSGSGGSGATGGTSGNGGSGGSFGGSGGSFGGSGGTGASGGLGGSGATGGSGGSGGTGGNTCTVDAFEPNDTSDFATTIDTGGDGKISDCEAAQQLDADIGLDDLHDWYTFYGLDSVCGLDAIEPHAIVTAPVSLDVCVFLLPTTGSSPPTCLEGSPASISGGYTGCCGPDSARLSFGSNFSNDEAIVLISVAGTNVCAAYTMEYAYGK